MEEKTTSLAKVKANRENALQSTGPKTVKGKEAVKWNALKHGLLAKEVVIREGDGKENKKEFIKLLSELRENLQPGSIIEEMLVERIAVCYWRLRRVLRCEIGEIRKGLDSASYREVFKRVEEFNQQKSFLILDESRHNIKKNSVGIKYLMDVLDEVIDETKAMGCLTKNAQERLIKCFGSDEGGLAQICFTFNFMATEGPQMAKEDPEEFGETPDPEKCNEAIISMIEEEKKKLQTLKEIVEDIENLELEARITSMSLPSKEAVEKTLRYETTIERQLYRAINQLERLQRQRRGEPAPPTINVDIT